MHRFSLVLRFKKFCAATPLNLSQVFCDAMSDQIASPVWMDINPSDTLQYTSAREHDDERHICPLQLEVIRRGILLWSNPDDVVLSPFMGIGSKGFCAVQMGRQFVGAELKTSYFQQAAKNLAGAVQHQAADLFADLAAA